MISLTEENSYLSRLAVTLGYTMKLFRESVCSSLLGIDEFRLETYLLLIEVKCILSNFFIFNFSSCAYSSRSLKFLSEKLSPVWTSTWKYNPPPRTYLIGPWWGCLHMQSQLILTIQMFTNKHEYVFWQAWQS